MRILLIFTWIQGILLTAVTSSTTSSPRTTTSSCGSITEISETLWEADSNRLSVADVRTVFPNLTQYTDDSIKEAIAQADSKSLPGIIINLEAFRGNPENNTKLFQYVKRGIPYIFQRLYDLYPYFNPATLESESSTEFKFVATQEFVSSVLQSPVLTKLTEYFHCRGINDDMWTLLYDTWFQAYSRYSAAGSYILDSSGFENVFVGEYSREPHQALGLHNWYRSYWQERAGEVDLLGDIELTEPNILALPFLWSDHYQASGSMFVGTSPDFDIAIYTLCFMELPDKECNVSLGGHRVTIKTETAGDMNTFLGTAHPVVTVPQPSINYMDLIPTTAPPTTPPDCGSLTDISEILWSADTSRLSFKDAKTLFPGLTAWTDASIAQAISQADPNALPDIILNYHNNQSKLFQYVRTSALSNDTYSPFKTLMGLYSPEAYQDDWSTNERFNQIYAFLDSVLQTDVMKKLLTYVQCKQYANDQEEFKRLLDDIWFPGYYRYTEAFGLDSSGFENTFLGEFGQEGIDVSGLHNWYRLYVLEQAGNLEYKGFINEIGPNVQAFTFDWDDHHQPQSSMWMGSSPEFEMAIYTLCYFEAPTNGCPVSLGGHLVSVMVDITEYYQGQVWSAYPELKVLKPPATSTSLPTTTTSTSTRTTPTTTTSVTTTTKTETTLSTTTTTTTRGPETTQSTTTNRPETTRSTATTTTKRPEIIQSTTTTTTKRPETTRPTTTASTTGKPRITTTIERTTKKIDCPIGLYGQACSEVCSMFCGGDGTCDIISGACNYGCDEGHGGKKCDVEVSGDPSKNKGNGMHINPLTVMLLSILIVIMYATRSLPT